MKETTSSTADVGPEQASEPEAHESFMQRMQEHLSTVVAQLTAAGALIVVFILLSVASRAFLTFNNLFNIISQTTVTAIIAIGMTFVIITAGIDLSVGSTAALGGMVGTLIMSRAHLDWPIGVVGGTLVGGLLGLVNGLLITKANLSPFITTLGAQSVVRGLVYLTTGAVGVYGLPESFALLGEGSIDGIPIPLIVLIVVA
ncbi:MAG TPA: ABC transporter permease, partial [Ktedonobacteraceae bacterium]